MRKAIAEFKLKEAVEKVLFPLLLAYGDDVIVYRADKSSPYSVYGDQAGQTDYKVKVKGKILIANQDDFYSRGEPFAGPAAQAFAYTNLPLDPGDVVEVLRTDGAVRRYKVEEKTSVGQTTSVVNRWILRPIVD